MLRQLKASVLAVIVLTLLLGLAYPLAITGLAQVLWPHQANGSRVELHGRPVGSLLIGQSFLGDTRYFQSRPSATGDDAADTAASNLGPSSARLAAEIRSRLEAYLRRERPYDPGLTATEVPADAVTASGSGVDPDISMANAEIQAHRVAAARGLPLSVVMRLISEHTDGLTGVGGVFGPRSVNVLALSLALDTVHRR
ncbi:MAG: potassium-transporting ATPase subunit KdpC [Solirubrobacteraceae bacterium]